MFTKSSVEGDFSENMSHFVPPSTNENLDGKTDNLFSGANCT